MVLESFPNLPSIWGNRPSVSLGGESHADILARLFPGSRRREIASLARERDPEIFNEGLLALAGRMEQEGDIEGAGRVYAALRSSEPRAQERHDAITGVGAAGPRAEFLLRRLTREALDPAPLAGMFAAGAVFRLTRIATLARGWRPISANLVAFGAEAAVFPLGTRLMATALGRELTWEPGQVGQELASSFIVLGAMRLTGSALNSPSFVRRGLGGGRGPAGLTSQAGMLGGILLGHRLESAVGLREQRNGATTWIDSLALLLQFNIAGRLMHQVAGPSWARWERELELRGEALRRPPLRAPWGGEGLQAAGVPFSPSAMSIPPTARAPLGGPTVLLSKSLEPSTPTGEALPETLGETGLFPKEGVDSLQSIRQSWMPRWLASSSEPEKVFSYEVLVTPSDFLRDFSSPRVIARRQGGEMTLSLEKSEVAGALDHYFLRGTPGFKFRIQEGEGFGEAIVYESEEAIQLFLIRKFVADVIPPLPQLAAGAGTVFIDWLATQAALRGKGFDVIRVDNPHIYEILQRSHLIETPRAVLQGCWFEETYGHGVDVEAPFLFWPTFALMNLPHFVNVRAQPHPQLLPAKFRTLSLPREYVGERGGGAYPYSLEIAPLHRHLESGHRSVIARREGGEILLHTLFSGPTPPGDRFFGPRAHQLLLELEEGAGRGKAALYLQDGILSGVNLETTAGDRPMRPGAGLIFMDWMATQTALHGLRYHSLYIKNARILRLLAERNLIDTATARARSGYWNWFLGDVEDMGPPRPFDLAELEAHLAKPAMLVPIVHVEANPNPGLLGSGV